LLFCNDVCSVIEALGHQHDPTEWRLFTDSSKASLKAVLLHNGNKIASVPMLLKLKSPMKICNYFWKRSSMKNMLGTFVRIKGHCSLAWLAAWLHKVSLLSV
jgi:hypothetical protein